MKNSEKLKNEIEKEEKKLLDLKERLKKAEIKEVDLRDLESVRNFSCSLYNRLLTEYGVFLIDDDYVDDMISNIIPENERKEFYFQLDGPVWGSLPYLKWREARLETLIDIMEFLKLVRDLADEGSEVDWWSFEWDSGERKLIFEGEYES